MKIHVFRMLVGTAILAAAFTLVWLIQNLQPYSIHVIVVGVVAGAAYCLGGAVLALLDIA
jgi:hypothetical protein